MINFAEMSEIAARAWPDLMAIVEAKVRPDRLAQNREIRARYWWRFGETTPALFRAIQGKSRVLANCQVSAGVTFAWCPSTWVFAHTLNVYPVELDSFFAVVQSRVHECWARFFGSSMKDDLRYTPSDCFETFPFPDLTPPPLSLSGEGSGVVNASGNYVSSRMIQGARQARKNPTESERRAWELVRDRRTLGLKFRREQVVGGFRLDLYCPSLRVALEIDGGVHDDPDQHESDRIRSEMLRAYGINILRVSNEDVTREYIDRLVAPLSRQGEGRGGEVREGATGATPAGEAHEVRRGATPAGEVHEVREGATPAGEVREGAGSLGKIHENEFTDHDEGDLRTSLEDIGRRYDAHRASVMKATMATKKPEGLTATYNRFHDANERSAGIATLRALHAEMDRAVLDAYGWTDLRPVYDYRVQLDERVRYTWDDDTRDEVLARLLEENRKRAGEDAAPTPAHTTDEGEGREGRARSAAPTGAGATKRTRKAKGDREPPPTLPGVG